MPDRVYLFDVDGTLTEPREKIKEQIEDVIMSWIASKSKSVYLVTGSDIDKTEEQLGEDLMDACLGVFTCSGNVFRQEGKVIYSNVFDPSAEFIADLQLYLDNSQWRSKKGNHIETRPGMLNFSTVGRNASLNMRKAYNRWDRLNLEREDIVAYINGLYPDLEVSIGGSISVDIYPKGKNKGQVVEKLRELHGDDVEMIFIGDKNIPGGNDWPLAQRLDTIEGSQWYQVLGPEETRSLIEYGELFIQMKRQLQTFKDFINEATDPAYFQDTFNFTVLISMDKNRGGSRDETKNDIRALPEVLTVTLIEKEKGGVQKDLGNTYLSTLKIHVRRPRDTSKELMMKRVVKQIARLKGVSVLR